MRAPDFIRDRAKDLRRGMTAPERASVRGIAFGQKIVLDDKTYGRLSGAVFDEIEGEVSVGWDVLS